MTTQGQAAPRPTPKQPSEPKRKPPRPSRSGAAFAILLGQGPILVGPPADAGVVDLGVRSGGRGDVLVLRRRIGRSSEACNCKDAGHNKCCGKFLHPLSLSLFVAVNRTHITGDSIRSSDQGLVKSIPVNSTGFAMFFPPVLAIAVTTVVLPRTPAERGRDCG